MMYIEDLLHIIVDTVGAKPADAEILSSISRQCKKGTPLTDRQFELVKNKIPNYTSELLEHEVVIIDLDNVETRLPLRQIDRSKYIAIADHFEVFGTNKAPYEARKAEWKWIKLRFPFSKKHIVAVENLLSKYRKQYHHEKGSHEHYFRLNENIIDEVVSAFIEKDFAIDKVLLDHYNEIQQIKANKNDYVPLYDGKFLNVDPRTLEQVDQELGEINSHNFLKLFDRRFRYAIMINGIEVNGLAGKIAKRENFKISLDPSEYSMNQIVEALIKLDRFPILVVVDNGKELEQVSTVYNAFNGVVPNEKQTVLFRVDGDNKYNLNSYVHDNNLNNWLDENTEIVYTSKAKLPKLLLKTEWKPLCVFFPTSMRSTTLVSAYTNSSCDLSIYHDIDTGLILERKFLSGYV